MFRFLKTIAALAILLGIALIIIYVLPTDIKLKGLSLIERALSASVREKIEKLTLSPVEERSTVIAKLDENLAGLGQNPSAEKRQTLLTDAQKLIAELKTLNEAPSLTEAVTANLTRAVLGNQSCKK